jgi:LmbE family N-acetylglucosaminyl deacetylase
MKNIIFIIAATILVAISASAKTPPGDLLDGVRPGPDGKIDILTVFAHQDDEGIYGGGALLKAMNDPRVRLHILCMTFDQTSDAIKNLKITPDHSGKIRVKELESAAAVYGADEVIQFKYPSRTLPKNNPEKLINEIKDEIDRTHAEIVITHDPAGFTGHWDHVACSKLATAAFKRSNAQVLYYPTLPKDIYRIVARLSSYRTKGAPAVPDFNVDIKDQKKMKKLACYEHASQMLFTSVGMTTDLILLMNHEYFTRITK